MERNTVFLRAGLPPYRCLPRGVPVRFSTSLKNNYDFRRLYAKGRSASSPFAVIYCRRNGTSGNRLGLTVSTKLGNAVRRNRIRRRFREIYRHHEEAFASGYDIVIVARMKSAFVEYQELESDFLKLCRKVGLCGDGK